MFSVAAGDGRHFFLQFAQLARQIRLLAIGGVRGFTLLLQQALQRISFLLLALLHAFKLLLQRLIGGDQLLRLLVRVVIAARAEGDDQHDSDRAEHRAGVLSFAAGSGWLLGALNRGGWLFNRGGWGILFRHSGTSHSQIIVARGSARHYRRCQLPESYASPSPGRG